MDQSHEYSNPLTRLMDVVAKLRASSSARVRLGPEISFILRNDSDREEVHTQIEMVQDYTLVLQMCVEAEQFVESVSPPKAKERNTSDIKTLTNKFYEASVNGPIALLDSNNLGEMVYQRLISMTENLSAYDNEKVISDSEIEALLREVDSLISVIRKSTMHAVIKDKILTTLGIIRIGITRINIVGPDEVVIGIDQLIGQSVRAALSEDPKQHKEGKGILARVLDFAQKIQGIVEAGEKSYPAISGVVSFIKNVLENGS